LRFTVHRPASAEVSPCCHRPSGGDVAGGVHVSIARARTAGHALENRLALAVLQRDMPAGRASLRRVRSGNIFEPPRSFAFQPGDQLSPPLAVNLTVEAPFLRDVGSRALTSTARRSGHGPHIQILDADRIESARHISGGLFHPVTAAICFASAQPGNGQPRSGAPVRSPTCSGEAPLQSTQPPRFASTKTGNAQQLSRGQRNRYRHTAINANYAAIMRPGDGLWDGSKSDMPAPRSIAVDSEGPHGVGYDAGPAEQHPTDLRDPHLAVAAAQQFDMAGFEPDLPKSFVLAGLTPRRATVSALEKVAHRLGEVAQSLLLHGLRPGRQPIVFGANRRQLSALFGVTGRLAAWSPVLLLLHGQIPHKPGVATVAGQGGCLLRGGKQPKPAHNINIGNTTDKLSKGGGRPPFPAKAGDDRPQT
jgi:hypothetical protein